MSTVVEILRYPLKSALGERLEAAELDVGGVDGDRAWACVDPVDGTVASAKHPRRWGRLLQVEALTGTAPDGSREVTLGVGGVTAVAGSPRCHELLAAHLGRAVRVTRTVPAQARLHRLLPRHPGLVPEWMADAEPGEEMVTPVHGAVPGGRFVDFGPVHLVTTGELARLSRRVGTAPVDAARFRPNLVVDADDDPPPGEHLQVGTAVLRTVVATPRCVVPGLAHGAAPADDALLGTLARHYRVPLPGRGRAACFGTYAEVVTPGVVQVGDAVQAPVALRAR